MMKWRRAGILTGLIFVGLFAIQGIFSLASALGQAPNSPAALLASAVEIYAVVYVYERATKSTV